MSPTSIFIDFPASLWEKKTFRFLCIGSINTLIDLTILNGLVFLFGLSAVIANLISASISITLSYFFYRRFVFRQQQRPNLIQFVKFFIITGLSILAVQSLVIYLVTHLLGTSQTVIYKMLSDLDITGLSAKFVNLNTAKILAVIMGLGWNFIFYHKVVFKAHIEVEDAGPV